MSFREVVPVENCSTREKINLTFRIQYVRDIVLQRHFDDSTFSTLNSMIFFNQSEIVAQLQNQPRFFEQLFDVLRSASITDDKRLSDVLSLLQEFCSIVKSLQGASKSSFFE